MEEMKETERLGDKGLPSCQRQAAVSQDVEIASIDLRYESCRMKHAGGEKALLASIVEHGIREPLQGVDAGEVRILLNGFKRYRCARKLGLAMVPYVSLGCDPLCQDRCRLFG